MLSSLSYTNVLARGFALVMDDPGKADHARGGGQAGDRPGIRFADRSVDALAAKSRPGEAVASKQKAPEPKGGQGHASLKPGYGKKSKYRKRPGGRPFPCIDRREEVPVSIPLARGEGESLRAVFRCVERLRRPSVPSWTSRPASASAWPRPPKDLVERACRAPWPCSTESSICLRMKGGLQLEHVGDRLDPAREALPYATG